MKPLKKRGRKKKKKKDRDREDEKQIRGCEKGKKFERFRGVAA